MSAVIERALNAELERQREKLRSAIQGASQLVAWSSASPENAKWRSNPRAAADEAVRLICEASAEFDEVKHELDVHLAAAKL